MPNVATLYQLAVERSYQRDGYQDLVNALKQVARQEVYSDALVATRAAGGAKADVVTNAAVRIYAIQCAMPSTSTTTAYLQLFNTSSATVTLGTTAPEFQVMITSQASRPILFPTGLPFSTALSWAVTTLPSGSVAANATNAPTVTLLYR
jgi:hypothetical protein